MLRQNYRSGYGSMGGYAARFESPLELKFLDTALAENLNDSGGDVIGGNLNNIIQGTSENQRIGRKITVKSIGIKFDLTWLDTNIMPHGIYTMVCILDKQANKTVPNWEAIYETGSVHSFRNLANNDRFRILKTWTGSINANSNANELAGDNTIYAKQRAFKWFKKLNVPIEYIGATGTSNQITSNNILLMGNTTGNCLLTGQVRIRFTDGR